MFTFRGSMERGHSIFGWLDSYHSFSFSDYYDPKRTSFHSLRAINEDIIAPKSGFDAHPHKDMEIITYIIEGELTHDDSTGISSILKRGDVQIMSAGTGVVHSEYNNSAKLVHLLQIWIIPERKGLIPRYETKKLPDVKNSLCLIASMDGREESFRINQDVSVYRGIFGKNHKMSYALESGRALWIQAVSGRLKVGNITLEEGDAVSIEHERSVDLSAAVACEFLVFDMA